MYDADYYLRLSYAQDRIKDGDRVFREGDGSGVVLIIDHAAEEALVRFERTGERVVNRVGLLPAGF